MTRAGDRTGAAKERTPVAVMGGLGHFDVAGILRLLGLRRATGRLQIVADGDDVSLYLADGRLILVTSSRLPLRLGRVLLQRNLLQPRQLHEALREQESGGHARSLGAIVVDRGWVSALDVARCVQEQCIVVLSRIIAAPVGTFVYSPDVATPPGVVTFPIDAGRVLMEATRRVDELAALRAQLPARYAPLAPSGRLDVTVATLTPDEEQVIAALRAGASSLGELTDLLPMDETLLLRTVVAMRHRGLLVAGQGAPGFEIGMPGSSPPSDDDLDRILVGAGAGVGTHAELVPFVAPLD